MAKAVNAVKSAPVAKATALPKRGNAKVAQAEKTATVAKATKRPSDVITGCKNASNGAPYLAVTAEGRDTILVPVNRMTAELTKLGKVGGSYSAFAAAWKVAQANPPVAKMANGLDGRNSPHVAKAVADAKAKQTPAKPPLAAKAAVAKAARKEEAKAKAAPKADDARAITVVKKDYAFGREGTARRASWEKCLKTKTAAAYIAAGGAAKYLPRWVAAGAIKLG